LNCLGRLPLLHKGVLVSRPDRGGSIGRKEGCTASKKGQNWRLQKEARAIGNGTKVCSSRRKKKKGGWGLGGREEEGGDIAITAKKNRS